MNSIKLYLGLAVAYICVVTSWGHGRLVEPPGRASMWRFGFNTPINYNDNELFCGGFATQYNSVNQGRCGICGDEWSLPQPRRHEGGGQFGTGTIARIYNQSDIIDVAVQMTATHLGWFEFRLCPHNNPGSPATLECLDQHLLQFVDGTTRTFGIDHTATYEYRVQLPSDVTCSQCVFQWKYHAGNNWGVGPNGVGGMGLGNQEEFYGCADIQILANQNADESTTTTTTPSVSTPSTTSIQESTTTTTQSVSTSTLERTTTTQPLSSSTLENTTTTENLPTSTSEGTTTSTTTTTEQPESNSTISTTTSGSQNEQPGQRSSLYDTWACRGAGAYTTLPGIDDWCVSNCAQGFCPATHCICDQNADLYDDLEQPVTFPGPDSECSGRGLYVDYPNIDQWCDTNCRAGYCPASHCVCFDVENSEPTVTPSSITCTAKRRFRQVLGNRRALAWCRERCERLDAHEECDNRCDCIGMA